MKPTTKDIVDFVANLDNGGLRVLIEQHNIRKQQLSRNAFHQFKPGDKITFASRRGYPVNGTVIRRMRKNILIEETTGARWRVSPTLLHRR